MINNWIKKIGVVAIILILIFFFIPLFSYTWISISSIKPEIFSKVYFAGLRISIISSLISLVTVMIIGLPSTYYYYMNKNYFTKTIFNIAEFPLVIPPSVSGLILLITFGSNGTAGRFLDSIGINIPFTIVAVIIAQIFVGGPLFLKNVKTSLEEMEEEVVNTGKILGLNETQIFFKIVLPQNKNAILSAMIITLSRMLSEFGATIMFAGNLRGVTQTLPLLIYSSMEKDVNIAIVVGFTLLVISLLIQITLKYFLNKSGRQIGKFN
ncbi:MAG: ABC transporter permease subunit [Bacillota bacterium]|nr:ABC transporter permease subunit [Bacillota bacterium]